VPTTVVGETIASCTATLARSGTDGASSDYTNYWIFNSAQPWSTAAECVDMCAQFYATHGVACVSFTLNIMEDDIGQVCLWMRASLDARQALFGRLFVPWRHK